MILNCLELYSRNLNLEFRTYSPKQNATVRPLSAGSSRFKAAGVE